jgi:hypothetical protein
MESFRRENGKRTCAAVVLRGKRLIPDDTKVIDLALRWRCRNCGYRGPESRVRVIQAVRAHQRR